MLLFPFARRKAFPLKKNVTFRDTLLRQDLDDSDNLLSASEGEVLAMRPLDLIFVGDDNLFPCGDLLLPLQVIRVCQFNLFVRFL